jgi:hypothetical protein
MKPRRLLNGLFGILLVAGCQSNWNTTPPPKTYPVQGKVVLAGGQAVRGGVITFHPKDPTGAEASGDIGSDGTFKLTTIVKGDGALPGQYTVSISPYSHKSGQPVAADDRIPRKYEDKRKSTLSYEVLAQENNFTIQLK